jgi:hypothetical protein
MGGGHDKNTPLSPTPLSIFTGERGRRVGRSSRVRAPARRWSANLCRVFFNWKTVANARVGALDWSMTMMETCPCRTTLLFSGEVLSLPLPARVVFLCRQSDSNPGIICMGEGHQIGGGYDDQIDLPRGFYCCCHRLALARNFHFRKYTMNRISRFSLLKVTRCSDNTQPTGQHVLLKYCTRVRLLHPCVTRICCRTRI